MTKTPSCVEMVFRLQSDYCILKSLQPEDSMSGGSVGPSVQIHKLYTTEVLKIFHFITSKVAIKHSSGSNSIVWIVTPSCARVKIGSLLLYDRWRIYTVHLWLRHRILRLIIGIHLVSKRYFNGHPERCWESREDIQDLAKVGVKMLRNFSGRHNYTLNILHNMH